MSLQDVKITYLVVLICVLLGVGGALSAAPDPKPLDSFPANVPGEWKTWYGTAWIDEVGEVVDYLATPPMDPLNTFDAHDGKFKGKGVVFALKTPEAGRQIFACGAMVTKAGTINMRYQYGGEWRELPPAKINPDFPNDFDSRFLAYWIDVPPGQTTTRFESDGKLRYAMIATPGEDPFAGQTGGKHPSFDIPDYSRFKDSEVGRALLMNFPAGAPKRLTEASYRQQVGQLDKFEKMPGSKGYIQQQKMCWGVAMDGLLFQATGDKRYAQLAGAKGARIAKWPTW